jgi:hypothetical protein
MKFGVNRVRSLFVYLSMATGNWQKLAEIIEDMALAGVDTLGDRQ